MNKALVDLDILVYRLGSVADRSYYDYKGTRFNSKKDLNIILKEDGVDDTSVVHGVDPIDWKSCKKLVVDYTEGILENFDDYQGYLSGKGNFRYKIATIQSYKGNRKSFVKPTYYDDIRQFYSEVYGAILSSGKEADDELGLAQCDGTVIVSTDKDLNCVPGQHYNWVDDNHYEVSLVEADRWHFKQLLTGDTTDNILGLFGVGEKSTLLKALDSMTDPEEMFLHVKGQYEKRFGSYWYPFLQENSQLLWILQKRECPTVKFLVEGA